MMPRSWTEIVASYSTNVISTGTEWTRHCSHDREWTTHQLLTKLWKLSEKYSDGNVGGGYNKTQPLPSMHAR